jgi:hypothetical protein
MLRSTILPLVPVLFLIGLQLFEVEGRSAAKFMVFRLIYGRFWSVQIFAAIHHFADNP